MKLFKRRTLDQFILKLGKLKVATLNGKTILRLETKEQKTFLEAFGISLPDYNTLKHPLSVPKKETENQRQRMSVKTYTQVQK